MKFFYMHQKFPILLALAFLFVTGLFSPLSAEKKPITIGALLPISGGAAIYAQYAREGAVVAMDEINRKGGIRGAKLEIVFEDSQTNSRAGVLGLQKLIRVNKVPATLIEVSGITLSCIPIADETETVLLNVGATSPRLVGAGKYLFSAIPNGIFEVDIIAKYAYENKGYRTMALLYPKDDFGTSQSMHMAKIWKAKGGKIVADESFESGGVDHRTQLSKIKAVSPDCIYCLAFGKGMGTLMVKAAELGVKTPVLSSGTFEMPEIISIAGKAAEGVVYATHAFDVNRDDPITENFVKLFKQKYKKLPEQYAGTAYDAVHILAKGIENVIDKQKEISGRHIRLAIQEIRRFSGVAGVAVLQDDGTVLKPMNIKTYRNGKFETIEIISF